MTGAFRVTNRARADIAQIVRYTRRVWGKGQSNAYARAIDRRIRWLAEDPRRGRQRDDIGPGCYCYVQGAHLIVYAIAADEVAIIGVPHQAMDLRAHFEGETWE